MASLRSLLCAVVAFPGLAAAQAVQLGLHPAAVTLDSARDAHRFVVIATDAQGITRDVSGEASIRIEPAAIAEFEDGRLRPLHDGDARIVVRYGEVAAEATVRVRGAHLRPPINFRGDVVPVLTRAGCNAGSCHGAAAGKNGFGLSLFGYDPDADHVALTRAQRGRRIDLTEPGASLLLGKATDQIRHKGGHRLDADQPAWRTLRDWIAEGAVDDRAHSPQLVSLHVEPPEAVLGGSGQVLRFVVTAGYADGSSRDVTDLALLSTSSATTAKLDGDTLESGMRGEAFLLARFGHLAAAAAVIVLPDAAPWTAPPMAPRNEIDELIYAKLRKLRLPAAGPCDDATFARRVFLDVIGSLPDPDELRAFLADPAEDKRARLVDALLERPEFSVVQAAQWADLLRIEADRLESKDVHLYVRWLREAFAQRVPIDEIVRRLLTASGSAFEVPEANYWVVATDPRVLAENAAQTFLGIRMQCAQCHNHPFERWTMDDYYGFAAFFAQVGRKRGDDPRDTIVFDQGSGSVTNPRSGKAAAPQFLGGARAQPADGEDRRATLAEWLTARDNPWFAANVANRVWARFFGRGLVEPVDDVRVSNPATHPKLLRRLGEKLAASGFDLRALIREICASATYQAAVPAEAAPVGSYAGATPRRMSAEQLLDAIAAVTGVPTKFRGLPLGASALQIADADSGSRFLELFGRPARETVCACERSDEPTFNQVLHLINGDTIDRKVRSEDSRLAQHLAAGIPPEAILDDLFLAAYARPPRTDERDRLLGEIAAAGGARAAAWQDLLWAIVNSKEFLFWH